MGNTSKGCINFDYTHKKLTDPWLDAERQGLEAGLDKNFDFVLFFYNHSPVV